MIADVREVEPAAFEWTYLDGQVFTRSWIIEPADTSAAVPGLRLKAALALLPAIGTVHPTVAGLNLTEKRCQPIAGTKAIAASAVYRQAGGIALVDLDARLAPEQTNLDKNGAAITTRETPGGEPTGRIVDFHNPELLLVVQKKYTTPIPDVVMSYVGKVNSDNWPPGNSPELPRFWLCSRIEIPNMEAYLGDGDDYDALLEFRWRGAVWDQIAIHEIDGEPIAAPVDGVSYKKVQTYPAVPFAPLAITL